MVWMFSLANAEDVLHEDWSDYELGDSIVSSGKWKMYDGADSQVIISEEGGVRVFSANYKGDDAVSLPYVGLAEALEMGHGVMMEITFQKTEERYIRVGFANLNGKIVGEMYYLDFQNSYAQFFKGTTEHARLHYTEKGFHPPVGDFATITLEIQPQEEGRLKFRVLQDGWAYLEWVDDNAYFFTEGVVPFIAFRDPAQGWFSSIHIKRI